MQKQIKFKSTGGWKLTGVLHTPAGSGPFPAVIVQHGLSSNHQSQLIKAIAKKLESLGFMVLRFSFSGHRPSGGSYKNVLISQFIKDIARAIKFLQANKLADSHRLGLVGHSMGAFTALSAAYALKKKLKAVVALSSYFDVSALIKNFRLNREIEAITKDYWLLNQGFKMTSAHFLDKIYRVKNFHFDQIHCPVLIIHGQKDDVVEAKDASLIYRLLPQSKVLKIFTEAGHDLITKAVLTKTVDLTAQWLIKYL